METVFPLFISVGLFTFLPNVEADCFHPDLYVVEAYDTCFL